MTATPPATDRPMIEPVPRPLELSEDDVWLADGEELETDGVNTTVLVEG